MDRFKENSLKHFEDRAETYNSSYDGRFVKCMYKDIIQRVIDMKPEVLLDLGCGNGNILTELSGLTGLELYGVDLSEKMIEAAEKKLGSRVKLTVGDAEKLPYESSMFDTIICNASFHHYPNPQTVLNEVKRVLKPNGTLILGDPTGPVWSLKILNPLLRYSNSGDYMIYSKKKICELLNQEGFKVTEWKKINFRSFLLSAQKL